MGITAQDLLRGYGNASLAQMARQRGLETKGKGKENLVQLLAQTLYDPPRIRAALEQLDPLERLLLNRLLLAGGDAPTEWLRRELQQEGLLAPRPPTTNSWGYRDERGSPWNRGSNKFEDLVARLGVLGLVFTAGSGVGRAICELSTPSWRLMVPAEIRAQLPPVTLPVESCAAPAVVATGDARIFLRDAYALLTAADRAPIPLTARGQIMKRALVQIDESLLVPEGAAAVRSEDDLGRTPLLRAVLEERALLVARPGDLILGSDSEAFLRRPAGDRLKMLFEAYLKTARWCELFRIAGLRISMRGGGGRVALPPVINARRRVIAELAEMPCGEWISVAHLVERIRLRSYEFLFSRSQVPVGYYYGQRAMDPYGGNNALGWSFDEVKDQIGDEEDGWDIVESGLIRVIVTEALYWLGLVDLGRQDGAQATAFRITPEGGQLLRGQTPTYAESEPHVVVQPNFQIFAFPPTGEDVLFELDRFAERVRAEQVVEYRLTRGSAYRAQHNGMSATAMIAFLEQVSKTPLPQNVRRTLEEWGHLHERIVVRRGSALLQALDDSALDALYANPEVLSLLGRRLTATTALVPSANLKVLYERMLGTGLLPALDEGPDDSAQSVFSVDASGRIVFQQRLPSIHVLRSIHAFADGPDAGVLELTASSLRRAARQGMDADQIIAVLEKWHAGPLPAEVPAMVRRWAKDWGQGALVTATLLQVQSSEILSSLLADPQIGPHLRPVPGSETLAVVRGESLEQIRSALEALGMLLGDELMGS